MLELVHSMLALLLRALMVFVGWFHPDVAHGVFWGSWLVTFVGSVMGDDQVKRLQNGAFGAAAPAFFQADVSGSTVGSKAPSVSRACSRERATASKASGSTHTGAAPAARLIREISLSSR